MHGHGHGVYNPRRVPRDVYFSRLALKQRWPAPSPEVAAKYAAKIDAIAFHELTEDHVVLACAKVRNDMMAQSTRAVEAALRCELVGTIESGPQSWSAWLAEDQADDVTPLTTRVPTVPTRETEWEHLGATQHPERERDRESVPTVPTVPPP